MRVKRCKHQVGDTLIEVMLASAVFSAVAVGCLTVMNRGLSIAQQSLESTLVRQQIDAQAEMLRFVHNNSHKGDAAMAELWKNLPKKDVANEILNVDTCPDHLVTVNLHCARAAIRLVEYRRICQLKCMPNKRVMFRTAFLCNWCMSPVDLPTMRIFKLVGMHQVSQGL